VAGSTVSRYVSNAGRSIYWSPPRVCPVLPGRCQLEHGQVAVDVGLSAWDPACQVPVTSVFRTNRLKPVHASDHEIPLPTSLPGTQRGARPTA
jgi:hypothetical protein